MYWFASLRISPHQQDVRCFTQGIECDEALRERNARPATFKWHELDDRLLQHFSQPCVVVVMILHKRKASRSPVVLCASSRIASSTQSLRAARSTALPPTPVAENWPSNFGLSRSIKRSPVTERDLERLSGPCLDAGQIRPLSCPAACASRLRSGTMMSRLVLRRMTFEVLRRVSWRLTVSMVRLR